MHPSLGVSSCKSVATHVAKPDKALAHKEGDPQDKPYNKRGSQQDQHPGHKESGQEILAAAQFPDHRCDVRLPEVDAEEDEESSAGGGQKTEDGVDPLLPAELAPLPEKLLPELLFDKVERFLAQQGVVADRHRILCKCCRKAGCRKTLILDYCA